MTARQLAVSALSLTTLANVAFADVPFPDRVVAEGEGFTNVLSHANGCWTGAGVRVSLEDASGACRVRIAAPKVALETVRLFWRHPCRADDRVYLETDTNGWRRVCGGQVSEWFFLRDDGERVEGWGVKVQPNAMLAWNVQPSSVEAVFDVRAAGEGVLLGERVLEAAELVRHVGERGESAFSVGRAFCRIMCPHPRLPKGPVFGYNDWYCAYGANTATNFLADAAYVVEMAKGTGVKPYVVMDDGWQENAPPTVKRLTGKFDSGWGPWERSGSGFGMDMKTFAARIAELGAHPGLWYRPMCRWDGKGSFDPTLPETKDRIRREITRFREWGFKLVKPDYMTYDFLDAGTANWAVPDHTRICPRVLRWRDRSRTSAEVMLDIYRTMREAAGDDMLIIGCNAVNHFAAGLFELQRTGWDTSGVDWRKTATCGVNAIGTRNMMNGTFFLTDPDCVGLAKPGAIPWERNRLWLELVVRSKSPLFISWKRSLATPEIRAAFRAAFAAVCVPGAVGEALDWQENDVPQKWRFADGDRTYDWFR